MEPGRPRPPRGHQGTGGPGRNVRRGPHHHLTCRGGTSALARLQPRVDAVDHVTATPATDYYRTRAQLEGPDRAPDLHGVSSQTRLDNAATGSGIPLVERGRGHMGRIRPTSPSTRVRC